MNTEVNIDSGNGYFYSAIPSHQKHVRNMSYLQDEIFTLLNNRLIVKAGLQPISKSYYFYSDRLCAVVNYGLVQGRELIKMICRCAFNDSSLTDNEAIVIMETCLDSRLDNILMEVNFNAGW